jgi:threonylcarbamoyladenosine tRNA methylthiotransferase MtaB
VDTFKIITLGCKVNQYEGQGLRQSLLDAGLSEACGNGPPSVVVVNTCCVTGEAARQSRQAVRKALGASRVHVTGCYAHPSACDDALRAIPVLVEADKAVLLKAVADEAGVDLPDAAAGVSEFGGHTRAFVKVQDGCNAGCSYCIVCRVRPDLCSRPVDEIIAEVRRLSRRHREIVICGIHLGKYGIDLDDKIDLAALVRRLLDVPELGRIRLSSIDPLEVTDELLGLMADCPDRLCPHLHLPLQSGDDDVLERMQRPYRSAGFLDVVRRARSRIERLSISTDVMLGFPGETEAAFENTVRVCREAGFSRIHIFPFSPRPGTPAASMDDKVPADVVKPRCRRLADVAEEIARSYRASLIGTRARLLIETAGGGMAEGLSERYIRVLVAAGAEIGKGEFIDAHLTGITHEGMAGQCAARARV